MKDILHDIDSIITNIKNIGDAHKFRSFDVKMILILEVLRLELSTMGEFTNFTLKAINQVISFTGRECYLYDYPEIYTNLDKLVSKLAPYNANFYSADIGIIGFDQNKWHNYFGGSIRYLIEKMLTNEGIE